MRDFCTSGTFFRIRIALSITGLSPSIVEAYRIKNVFQSSKDFRAATFAALSSRELDRLRSRMGLSSYATCALPEKKLAKRFLWACLLLA